MSKRQGTKIVGGEEAIIDLLILIKTMRGGKRQGAGRKKGEAALGAEKARELIVQMLSQDFAPIVAKAIKQAKDGDHRAREWLSERAYGRVQPAQDIGSHTQQNIFALFIQAANSRASEHEINVTPLALARTEPKRDSALVDIKALTRDLLR